jgi:hypothetical protein
MPDLHVRQPSDPVGEAHEALDRLLDERPLLPTRPLVIDSDVLMRNIVAEALIAQPPTKLLVQARMTTIRIYVATHQLVEIRKHLPEVAAAKGVDPERALAIFGQQYLPLLWHVDVTAAAWDGMASTVFEVDPGDGPVARLGVVLGLRVVTANKRHFKDFAVQDDWFTVVSAYASVGLFDGVNGGAVVSARISGEGAKAAAHAAQAARQYLGEHPRVALVALGVVGALLIFAVILLSDPDRRRAVQDWGRRHVPTIRDGALYVLQKYVGLAEAAFDAEGVVLASKLPLEERSLEQKLAEFLGRSKFPVSIGRLTDGLSPAGRKIIEAALENNLSFVCEEDRWTLGSRLVATES